MLNVKENLCNQSLDAYIKNAKDLLTLLVIFGPRGSLVSSAWTRASPTAKTRKKDKNRLLKFIVAHNCRQSRLRAIIVKSLWDRLGLKEVEASLQ